MKELPKAYEPKLYEDKIYEGWEKSGFFNPDNLTGDPYSILFPPPNVTGVLHLGHALENSLMDVMTRYQRMKGKKVLLLPGTDHAAVATQAKVEKELVKEGIKHPREELGREKLLERIREYSENSKATILNQIRKMGTSCDWTRLAYTFDEPRSRAVNEVFKKMYDDGLIYRGYRVVNWSVKGQSTCSDDELVHIERAAKLYTFKYSKDFPITIATTRPETKLGDTAVAVNPSDERYKKYIGQTFVVDVGAKEPLNIKIIADENVDLNFGTGALGVTPAHSQVDFEMYEKQKASSEPIGFVPVIGKDGKMLEAAGKEYTGLMVEEAREKFVNWLRENDLLEKEEDIVQNVGTSDRFQDVVEALPMVQWFVDVNKIIPGRSKTLKDLMREVVTVGHNGNKDKKIKITPERFEKIYLNWIDNLRDWCISRQIWWGHRVPVWYKKLDKGIDITFIRHAESQANADKIAGGHSDTPLTEKGKEETRKLAERINIGHYDCVYTSDLNRALETSKILFAGHPTIILDKRLREIDYGDLTLKSTALLDEFRVSGFPNGENYKQVTQRVLAFLSEIAEKHDGQKIAVVGHNGTWKALENIINRMPLSFENIKKNTGREPLEYKLNELSCVDVSPPQGSGWTQDPDTLDTWFSSGLWTFSTLGWPEGTKDLEGFHPTSWMQMGHEILFFWMARMILMTTYTLNEIPFYNVYIHGILRDEKGQKFSKSLNNGVDPLDMIEKYGCDALRLSLLSGITPGNDARFYTEKVEGARNFVNKLWNISRYVLGQIGEIESNVELPKVKSLSDEWIINRLHTVIKEIEELFDRYDFSLASEKLRDFTWNDFADWYLEIAKIEGDKQEVLRYVLVNILKLWHPFIPFVTEEIWQEVFGGKKLLMVEKWPELRETVTKSKDNDFELIKNVITGIRSLRSDYKIEPAKKMNVVIQSGESNNLWQENAEAIKGLARLESLVIGVDSSKPKSAITFVVKDTAVHVDIAGVVDIVKEKARLSKELEETQNYFVVLDKKLATGDFVKNAPAEVVGKERAKMSEAEAKLEKLKEQLKSLEV